MSDPSIYEYLTRLSRLLQAEERVASPGLQPVQLHALHYLSRCNRYSDRPAAVAAYLGVTKGTASQTLRVLEQAGHIAKRIDPDDRRIVRLSLTAQGKRTLRKVGSMSLLDQAVATFSPGEAGQLETSLARLLRSLQRANQSRSFGVCHTCRHFQTEGGDAFRCGLTGEPLTVKDTELLCREHQGKTEAA